MERAVAMAPSPLRVRAGEKVYGIRYLAAGTGHSLPVLPLEGEG
jgi:hypothetical protein